MSTKGLRFSDSLLRAGILKIRQEATGYMWDGTNGGFTATPATDHVVPVEDADFPGLFSWSDSTAWPDGSYQFFWYPTVAMDVGPKVWGFALVEDQIPDTSGGSGGGVGTGSVAFTWSEYESGHSGDPAYAIGDVTVSVYNNIAAEGTPTCSGVTDETGAVTLYLDPGTYYLFRRKNGRSFTNPTTISVG